MAASANTTGTMPPISNRIGQPYCGTSAAAAKPASAPPSGTRPTAMIASVARRLRGAEFGIDGDEVRNDAADAEAGDEAQPEQLGEIGRIGGDEGEDAEQQVGEDQRGLAAVAVADQPKICEPNSTPILLALSTRPSVLAARCAIP